MSQIPPDDESDEDEDFELLPKTDPLALLAQDVLVYAAGLADERDLAFDLLGQIFANLAGRVMAIGLRELMDGLLTEDLTPGTLDQLRNLVEAGYRLERDSHLPASNAGSA